MKIVNIPITLIALFTFISLSFIYGCKKEEPLEPNPVMELYQTEHYAGGDDWGGLGDTTGTGGGTDTTGGGGGVNVNEHFTVDIDGVLKSYSNPSYSPGPQILSSQDFNQTVQILLMSASQGDTINFPRIEYYKSISNQYSAVDGRMVIDSSTTDFIKGTFYCNVERLGDTISLTNGSFKVAK